MSKLEILHCLGASFAGFALWSALVAVTSNKPNGRLIASLCLVVSISLLY